MVDTKTKPKPKSVGSVVDTSPLLEDYHQLRGRNVFRTPKIQPRSYKKKAAKSQGDQYEGSPDPEIVFNFKKHGTPTTDSVMHNWTSTDSEMAKLKERYSQLEEDQSFSTIPLPPAESSTVARHRTAQNNEQADRSVPNMDTEPLAPTGTKNTLGSKGVDGINNEPSGPLKPPPAKLKPMVHPRGKEFSKFGLELYFYDPDHHAYYQTNPQGENEIVTVPPEMAIDMVELVQLPSGLKPQDQPTDPNPSNQDRETLIIYQDSIDSDESSSSETLKMEDLTMIEEDPLVLVRENNGKVEQVPFPMMPEEERERWLEQHFQVAVNAPMHVSNLVKAAFKEKRLMRLDCNECQGTGVHLQDCHTAVHAPVLAILKRPDSSIILHLIFADGQAVPNVRPLTNFYFENSALEVPTVWYLTFLQRSNRIQASTRAFISLTDKYKPHYDWISVGLQVKCALCWHTNCHHPTCDLQQAPVFLRADPNNPQHLGTAIDQFGKEWENQSPEGFDTFTQPPEMQLIGFPSKINIHLGNHEGTVVTLEHKGSFKIPPPDQALKAPIPLPDQWKQPPTPPRGNTPIPHQLPQHHNSKEPDPQPASSQGAKQAEISRSADAPNSATATNYQLLQDQHQLEMILHLLTIFHSVSGVMPRNVQS